MIPIKSKKIFDSVHGFIHLDHLESRFIQTRPFQRLHDIHQLGVAYLVYPGGTHRRYEHSLGVMQLATHIFDHLVVSTYDIILTSQFEGVLYKEVPKFMSPEYEYWRKIVRLAALCHDLGHLPFSHSAEKNLLGEGGHELWTTKFIQSKFLRPFWSEIAKEMQLMRKSPEDVEMDILKTAVGPEDLAKIGIDISYSPWEKIVCAIITADFFGADRIDYLLRDAKYTGITYGLFDYHQLIEMLRILPIIKPNQEPCLVLGVEEEGIESCEALLMSRYFMYKRICHYSTVKSYTWHLKSFMEKCYKTSKYLEDLDEYITFTEHEVFSEMYRAEKDPNHPGHIDAVSFFNQDKRCKAISLSEPISRKFLDDLLDLQQIPKEQVFLEIPSADVDFKTILDFPVLKKDGNIFPCQELSRVTVPTAVSSWIYLPSSHEKVLRQNLELSR
jgi:HD superfamily phosphohydrolase